MNIPRKHNLNKAKIAEHVHNTLGLTKRECNDIVERVFAEMSNALLRGEPVKITNFGTFSVRRKPARPGRNPKTLEAVEVEARSVVSFHAAKRFKSKVESGKE